MSGSPVRVPWRFRSGSFETIEKFSPSGETGLSSGFVASNRVENRPKPALDTPTVVELGRPVVARANSPPRLPAGSVPAPALTAAHAAALSPLSGAAKSQVPGFKMLDPAASITEDA